MLNIRILLLILFISGAVQSQEKFEPALGRVIHGLGQYEGYFYSDEEIWKDNKNYELAAGKVPVLYSVYASIDPQISSRNPTDYNDIRTNHSYPYLLAIGLLLHNSNHKIDVEAILNGNFDKQIKILAGRIKNINAPVFLRPGFEFGANNRGFHNQDDLNGEAFIKIWMHIYNIFDQLEVTNVAWVWNTVNTARFKYMEWYPGDNYVDWWGVNIFDTSQMRNSRLFIKDAEKHKKPVMICESNPINYDGTLNNENWQKWFEPYFNLIKSEKQIKAFIYTNSPWTKGPFASWPDSRISINTFISEKYRQQLTDPIFIHMDEYLSDKGILQE